LEVLGRGAAVDPVDLVALVEQQLGEVRAVLARDARDQCAPRFAHYGILPIATRSRAVSRVSAGVRSSGVSGPQPGRAPSFTGSPQTTATSDARIRPGSGSTVTGTRHSATSRSTTSRRDTARPLATL